MLALEQWLVTDFNNDMHYNKNVTKNCWTFPTLFEGCHCRVKLVILILYSGKCFI